MLFSKDCHPLAWAVVWWLAIEDSPSTAKWLPDDERIYLAAKFAEERLELTPVEAAVAWRALIHPVVWLIAIIYFLSQMGGYGLSLWMPTLVKSLGVSSMNTGWLLMLPNFIAIFALIYAARLSDRLRTERSSFFGPL